MRVKYQNYLDEYLSAVPYESQRSFYDMPTTVAQDTAYRYALRVAKVAEVAATVSGQGQSNKCSALSSNLVSHR